MHLNARGVNSCRPPTLDLRRSTCRRGRRPLRIDGNHGVAHRRQGRCRRDPDSRAAAPPADRQVVRLRRPGRKPCSRVSRMPCVRRKCAGGSSTQGIFRSCHPGNGQGVRCGVRLVPKGRVELHGRCRPTVFETVASAIPPLRLAASVSPRSTPPPPHLLHMRERTSPTLMTARHVGRPPGDAPVEDAP